MKVAVDDAGQCARLEFIRTVLDHWLHAEDREVDGACRVHRPAGPRHFLEEQRGLGDAEAVAAVLRRDGHAEPAAPGDGVVELLGELVSLVFGHPIVVAEFACQRGSGLADQRLILGQLETHPAGHDASPPVDPAQTSAPVRLRSIRTGALDIETTQSVLPVSSLALAAKSANVAPVFSL